MEINMIKLIHAVYVIEINTFAKEKKIFNDIFQGMR